VIGVDGKGTLHINGKDSAVKSCKALQRGNTVYVTSGGIPPGLREIIRSNGALTEKTNKEIVKSLEAMIGRIMTHDPARYSQYRPGYPALTIFASQFTLLGVILTRTTFVSQGKGAVVPETTIASGSNILCLCDTSRPVPIPPNWAFAEPTETIKKAFTILFKYDTFSGPPVTIVRITPGKIEWLGACRDESPIQIG
jgi:hypothetical protein